eukprot:g5404.t1
MHKAVSKTVQAIAVKEVECVSPLVTRVLGLNPGPFTLGGTNTYLVGSGDARILIDTGEGGRPQYLANLQAALEQSGGRTISHLVLTHYHHDHVGGAQEVCDRYRPKRVLKFPLPGAGARAAESPADDAGAHARGESGGVAFSALTDGDELAVPTREGQNPATLRVLHTPGHSRDHVALLLREEGRGGVSIFTADCVLGAGTAVFEDLATYMSSLQRILDVAGAETAPGEKCRLFPGHGPVIEDGCERITEYMAHRLARERQIVAALRARGGASASAMQLVEVIYRDTPQMLWPAAAGNVRHHLTKLERDGVVRQQPGGAADAVWALTDGVADTIFKL